MNCFLHLQKNYDCVIDDCSHAVELNTRYIKAMMRRARAYEITGKLMSCLEGEPIFYINKTQLMIDSLNFNIYVIVGVSPYIIIQRTTNDRLIEFNIYVIAKLDTPVVRC